MTNIDYKKILDENDIELELAITRTAFVKEFMAEAQDTCKSFEEFKDLIRVYDSHWNSIMDILIEKGLSENLVVKNAVDRTIIETMFDNMIS